MTPTRDGWAARRGRTVVVVSIIVGAALALVASTQVWAHTSVAGIDLTATGADALALLQPISLAALALSLALALTGLVVRLVLAALAAAMGVAVIWIALPIAATAPVSAVERVVTEHTGIAGLEAVSEIVSPVTTTAWPVIAIVAGLILAAAGVAGLATGASWRRGSSRYDAAPAARHRAEAGPLDAVDSWDELSRGDDPTRGE